MRELLTVTIPFFMNKTIMPSKAWERPPHPTHSLHIPLLFLQLSLSSECYLHSASLVHESGTAAMEPEQRGVEEG